MYRIHWPYDYVTPTAYSYLTWHNYQTTAVPFYWGGTIRRLVRVRPPIELAHEFWALQWTRQHFIKSVFLSYKIKTGTSCLLASSNIHQSIIHSPDGSLRRVASHSVPAYTSVRKKTSVWHWGTDGVGTSGISTSLPYLHYCPSAVFHNSRPQVPPTVHIFNVAPDKHTWLNLSTNHQALELNEVCFSRATTKCVLLRNGVGKHCPCTMREFY
jgi:hypothetical protein